MALRLRQSSASKVRVISTTIAVFALVIQPMYGFVSSQVANAAAGRSETVRTASQLLTMAGDQDVTTIKLGADISLEPSEKLIFAGRAGKTLVFDGKGYTLSMINNPAGWNQNDENYVVQAYKSSVKVQDITIAGGDAAILVNGATVELNNSVNVSNNTFGGIEVSQGVGVTTPAILKGTSNLVLTNDTEANGQPTAWIDQVDAVDLSTAVKISKLKETTHIGNNQKQYYLNLDNSNTVATNTTKRVTYDNLQTALDSAVTGDTVELNKSVNIAAGEKAAIIKSSITFDGNGNSIATLGNRGNAGDNKNAALIVVSGATGATIENVTVRGNGSGTTAMHGIVVDQAVSDVALNNVTAENNAAGVIINSANVTIKNIQTVNNNWYGINLDGRYGHATLSISGENVHSDFAKPAIFSEDGTKVTFVDEDEYNQVLPTTQAMRAWYSKSDAPVVPNVSLKDANGKNITNGYISTENFTFSLESESAVTYKIEYWNEIEGKAFNGRANAWPTTRGSSGIYSDRFSQGEGKHYFAFSACDAVGNCSASSNQFELIYDKTKPSISTLSLDKTPTKEGTLTLSGVVNDTNLSSYQVRVQTLDRKNTNPYVGASGSISTSGTLATLDIGKLVEGDYLVRVWATDKANNSTGNDGITTYYLPFTIDRTAPEIISSTYDNATNKMTVVTNDDADDVVLYVGVNNTELRPILQNGTTWVFDVASFNTPGATYTYTVSAVDAADNVHTTDSADLVTGVTVQRSFTVPDPFIGGGASVSRPSPIENPISPFRSSFAVTPVLIQPTAETETDVLGAQDEKAQTSPIATVAAIEPSAQGWKFFGFAWFWWLLAAAAITAIWWWIAAARRRSQEV